MQHIVLPEGKPLTFYLAQEEVAARRFAEPCFFTWVVPPTVICGHNQVIENEVNLDFCRSAGIKVVRRKSGGGCVYADEGNIMMSYVTPLNGNTVEEVFARYLEKAVGSLRSLGNLGSLYIHTSGRNDILLGDRKISGSALYVTPDKRHAIAHGTLLHSTDIERMVHAITPSAEKLAKNGVASVRQRVTNLTEHISITIPELRRHLVTTLCDHETSCTDDMMAEAEELMRSYLCN